MIGYRKSYRDIFIGIIQIVPFFALCYLYNQMEKYKEAQWPFSDEYWQLEMWSIKHNVNFQMFHQIEELLLLYFGIMFLLPLIYNLIRKKFRFVLAQLLLMIVGFTQFAF